MKDRLTRSRLEAILTACRDLKVGVVGDFTLDAYWYADMTRAEISRETPLYARPVVRETYSPGGAANVAWNLADLGAAEVHALTVLGDDWRGDLFRGVLERAGVSLEHTVFERGWSTPLYGKVVLTNGALSQEDPRIDFVNTGPLPVSAAAALRASVHAAVLDLDAVVVADYQAHGVLDADTRQALNDLARTRPAVTWVADSRAQIGVFQGMTLKPNEIEAARLFFPDRPFEAVTEGELQAAAQALEDRTDRPLVITRGARGCWVFDQGEVTPVPAVAVPPPIDPVGAGDTFVACLACCLAVGAAPWEAAAIATLAAAVTVRMLNITGTASPDAILAQYEGL